MTDRRAITRVRVAVVAALVLVVLLAVGPVAAHAQAPSVIDGFSLSTDGELTGARLRVVNTFPGDTRSIGIFLEGGYTAAVDLIALELSDLVDLENSCLRPEEREGDDCTSPDGELSEFLWLSSVAGWEGEIDGKPSCDPAPDGATTAPTRLDVLIAGGELDIPRPPSDAGEVMCGVVTLHFSDEAGNNLAQSDSATFTISTIFQWDPERVPEEFWTGGTGGGPGGAGGGTPPPTVEPVDPDPDAEDPDPEASPSPDPSPSPAPTPAPDGTVGREPPALDESDIPEIVLEPDDDEVAGTGGSRGNGGGRLPYTGATVLGMLLFGAIATTLGALLLRVRRPVRTAEVRP